MKYIYIYIYIVFIFRTSPYWTCEQFLNTFPRPHWQMMELGTRTDSAPWSTSQCGVQAVHTNRSDSSCTLRGATVWPRTATLMTPPVMPLHQTRWCVHLLNLNFCHISFWTPIGCTSQESWPWLTQVWNCWHTHNTHRHGAVSGNALAIDSMQVMLETWVGVWTLREAGRPDWSLDPARGGPPRLEFGPCARRAAQIKPRKQCQPQSAIHSFRGLCRICMRCNRRHRKGKVQVSVHISVRLTKNIQKLKAVFA